LGTVEYSLKTRPEENTTKEQTSEMKYEAAPDKEQELIDEDSQKRNATNNYNSQGEVAGDILKMIRKIKIHQSTLIQKEKRSTRMKKRQIKRVLKFYAIQ
jgi:hypothetical protein